MGKFNLKFVKPVASLAIGAAVLTGSFAVTGAADTAFAKAATVKVSKGKLVSAKSGKAVKGYKSYKGILYKNGKKFTGLYKNTYYKSGKKGTGLYKNVYYKAGKKGSGYVGTGSSKKWYQDGKLLTGLGKNSGKLFVKGKLYSGIYNLNNKGEKLYNKGVVVVTVIDAAKAINNTTVEVTFASAQKASDISAGRFAIEGLEISNAAVKQTDDKVIVLTTAAQTGGKTYTVALDGVKSRTFKGVSNVPAKAITNLTPSLQGVIGKEVTVKTQVDVEAGQSKAGIAVTFNITNSADTSNSNFGKKITAEVFTDANGVASYSYTQYVAGTEDVVEAYPTGNASVKATAAKVYWGNAERLTISDVTTGSDFANGSKKVYKVVSPENANKNINVTFKENVNVNPDKLVRSVKVIDANGREVTPYQVLTGNNVAAEVRLDSKGEATFTVTGSNATVTPIVFADALTKLTSGNVYVGNGALESTELQAQASAVTFGKIFTQKLEVKAEGEQRAAAYSNRADTTKYNSVNNGGRSYTVTITGKDGKLAPAGTKAYVTFKSGDVSKNAGGNEVLINGSRNNVVEIEVGSEGQATFKLTGPIDSYATPTVFIDNGTSTGGAALDSDDLQLTGETTYFVNEVIKSASISVDDADKVVAANTPAVFSYQSLDQNGNPYAATYNGVVGKYDVSFQVNTTFNNVSVEYTNASGTHTEQVKPGGTQTFRATADTNGKAQIKVIATGAADVTVSGSAAQVSLPEKELSISYVNGNSADVIVSDAVVALINGAKDKAGVISALEQVAEFNRLSADSQDEIVQDIYDNYTLTPNNVKAAYVSELIKYFKTVDATESAIEKGNYKDLVVPFGANATQELAAVQSAVNTLLPANGLTARVTKNAAGNYVVTISGTSRTVTILSTDVTFASPLADLAVANTTPGLAPTDEVLGEFSTTLPGAPATGDKVTIDGTTITLVSTNIVSEINGDATLGAKYTATLTGTTLKLVQKATHGSNLNPAISYTVSGGSAVGLNVGTDKAGKVATNGTAQVSTITVSAVAAPATGSSNVAVTIKVGTKEVTKTVALAAGETKAQFAAKIASAFASEFTGYTVANAADTVTVTAGTPAANVAVTVSVK